MLYITHLQLALHHFLTNLMKGQFGPSIYSLTSLEKVNSVVFHI